MPFACGSLPCGEAVSESGVSGIGGAHSACYDGVMADDVSLEERLTRAEDELARRVMFNRVLVPGVLDEMEEFLGVKGCIFAFQKKEDGSFDTLEAMRVDTLAGAMRALRLEASEEYVTKQKALVDELRKEVEHA